MRAKWIALALTVVLAFYLVTLGQRGAALVATGDPVAVGLGVGVLLLPLLGGYAVFRELRFGQATQRMARELGAQGGLPLDDVPRKATDDPDRSAADASFARYRAEVEQEPQDWRAWFRLGVAYDVAGDRKRARASMRHAIELHTHAGG